MQIKHVAALLLIGVIVAGLVVLNRFAGEGAGPSAHGPVEPLLPRDFLPRDVRRLVVASGPAPARRVVLERANPASPWTVASRFGARANQEKAADFLTALLQLGNRLEARPADDPPLSHYGLTSGQALHVAGRGSGGRLLFHLLAGGPNDTGTRFYMRPAGHETVYSSPINLWAESELAPAGGRAFRAAPWLDLGVTSTRPSDIVRVSISTPGKELTLERAAGADAGEAAEEAAPAWALTAGGFPGARLREGGAQTLANHLARITASGVADPERAQELGLTPPTFTAELTLRSQDDPLRLFGGRPSASGPGYVRAAGDAQVFVLESQPFEMTFGLGSVLFELPGLDVALADVTRLNINAPDYAAAFERSEGDAWILAEPDLGIPPSPLAVNAAAGALAGWAAADYADGLTGTGLAEPGRTAAIAFSGGARRVSIGAPSGLVRGRYVQLDGVDAPLVMRQNDVNLIFPPLRDLFDRRLMPVDTEDITRLEVTLDGATAALSRTPEGWRMEGASRYLPAETVDALLPALASWQAGGVTLRPPALDAYPARIALTARGGAAHAVELSAPIDGFRFARVNGGPPAYLVLDDAFEAIAAALPITPEPAPTVED